MQQWTLDYWFSNSTYRSLAHEITNFSLSEKLYSVKKLFFFFFFRQAQLKKEKKDINR